jgi:uncharacterized protein (TIGR03067 family)
MPVRGVGLGADGPYRLPPWRVPEQVGADALRGRQESSMRSAFAALSLLVIVATGTRAEPDKKPQDNLDGTWEVTDFVMDGVPEPEGERKGMRFIFKDDHATFVRGSADKLEFTLKLDPTKKPKEVDFTAKGGPFDGQTALCIYDLDSDMLKLCVPNKPTKVRPKEFKSAKGSGIGYIVLKRAKSDK